ncbi:MAG TPA: carbohydrate ABC transporter permease [Streptosporangiaceae bacterium]|nr:carbohydrate ABC transporter permease [Streptosporangiaceae bacterium]
MSTQSNEIPIKLYGLRRGTVTALTLLSALFALFILIPIVWLVINSTKTQANLFQTFGFWFASPFAFFENFGRLFENIGGNGTYIRWFANTAFYALLGGGGATVLCTLAGYGFARYRFRGSQALFYVVMAALMVPITAITFPLFLLYTKVGLINSIWGLILPSMLTPVGMYIMRTYAQLSVPRELMDAARLDGAGEVRIFFRIALPLMVPGVMTVLLIAIVAVWNNYFLPLLIFSRNELFPLTQGMGVWSSQAASTSGTDVLYPMIVIGGLFTIVPLVTLFLLLQRYWRGGLLLGSIAN